MEKTWKVYILRCKDGTLYCGSTNDLPARFAAHSAGRGAKYTRGRGPLELVYSEECESKSVAFKREWEIKSLSRQEKLEMIAK